jgi:hypothetical protein
VATAIFKDWLRKSAIFRCAKSVGQIVMIWPTIYTSDVVLIIPRLSTLSLELPCAFFYARNTSLRDTEWNHNYRSISNTLPKSAAPRVDWLRSYG